MFNIKIYQKDGVTLKNTLEIEKLESVSDFSAQVNGGFGNLNIGIAYKIEDTSINVSDIVKIQFKNNIIYIGSVINVKKLYTASKEMINLNLIGFGSLLTFFLTNYTFSDTVSNIIKELIDDFNIEYGSNILYYDLDSIPNTSDIISLDFSKYVSYFKAIETLAETTGLYFYIDLDGKVFLKEKTAFNKHILTLGLDVDEISIDEDGKELINTLMLKYNGGTKTYLDAGSITIYGKREKYIDKSSELVNETTADIYGENYISLYKEKIKKISLKINNKYNFFDIKGGDLINIKNTNYILENLQVAKINYGLDEATIELEKSYSFAKEIFNS